MLLKTLILFLPLTIFAQKIELKTDSTRYIPSQTTIYAAQTCTKGEQEAITDFNNGNYNYYTYGLTLQKSNKDKQIDLKVKQYLKTKYAIHYQHMGCIVFEDAECYAKKMKELVDQKFGKDFFELKYEEAYAKMSAK